MQIKKLHDTYTIVVVANIGNHGDGSLIRLIL